MYTIYTYAIELIICARDTSRRAVLVTGAVWERLYIYTNIAYAQIFSDNKNNKNNNNNNNNNNNHIFLKINIKSILSKLRNEVINHQEFYNETKLIYFILI